MTMDVHKSAKRLAFAGFVHPLWKFGARKYFADHHTPYAIHGSGDSVLVCKIHNFYCRIRKNLEQHVIPGSQKITCTKIIHIISKFWSVNYSGVIIETGQRVQASSEAPQVTCRHKAIVGKSYTLLIHNLSTRSRTNMATETNGKTNKTQTSSISSIFNDMKTMLDDFDRACLTILTKSLARNWMSWILSPFTLTRPTLMRTQIPIGLTIMGKQITQPKMTVKRFP